MIRVILVFAATLVLFGCATTSQPQKEEPQPVTQTQYFDYKEGENLFKKKKYPQAIKKLYEFLKANPKTDVSDNAAYYLAQMHHELGEQKTAISYWLYIVNGDTQSEFADVSTLRAAQGLAQSGRSSEALTTILKFKPVATTEKSVHQQILELSGRLKAAQGQNLEAVRDLYASSKFLDQITDKQALINRAGEIIGANLSLSELEQIATDSDLSLFEPLIRYRLGILNYTAKNWGPARNHFAVLTNKFTGTEYARRGQQYLNLLDAREVTDSNVVGVLLPLSGKNAQAGQKALRGLQLAFGIFGKNSSGIKLAVIDSEGTSEAAQKAVERLVTEDHVIAIVGDITSKSAQVAAQKAQELGVPCLTLSQKQGLTEIGEWIFRVSLTPDMQMRALADFAVQKRGLKRFAILYPNDVYGTEHATAFWDYVLLNGGQVVAAQTYAPDEKDFREAIQRLAGTFYEEDRGKELAYRLNEWKKAQTSKSARLKPPKDILPPVVDFDALFIPDSPKVIGQISAMLAYNDINNVVLLGTNLWNSPQLPVRAGKAVENSLFFDEILSAETNPNFSRFSNEFHGAFGYKPDIIESQAFDAGVTLLSAMKASGFSSSRAAIRDQLFNVSTTGASGILKMSPRKEIEKSLIPLTVTKGSVVKSDTGGGSLK
ncbi:MAG: penicillin-binding protein activator [Oligoflexia bacterium]|nr:penicillin-binding protein activator [Oligoflexia bacterium]